MRGKGGVGKKKQITSAHSAARKKNTRPQLSPFVVFVEEDTVSALC